MYINHVPHPASNNLTFILKKYIEEIVKSTITHKVFKYNWSCKICIRNYISYVMKFKYICIYLTRQIVRQRSCFEKMPNYLVFIEWRSYPIPKTTTLLSRFWIVLYFGKFYVWKPHQPWKALIRNVNIISGVRAVSIFRPWIIHNLLEVEDSRICKLLRLVAATKISNT